MLESGFSKLIKLFLSCFRNGFNKILDKVLSVNLSSEVDGIEINDINIEQIIKIMTNLLILNLFLVEK
jgi:hypothetical protein